jgi:hypothetical protein
LPVLFLVPRTCVLGAILLTGYPGGAGATRVRVEGGVFPVLSPVILGALLWGGLVLRDNFSFFLLQFGNFSPY